MGNQTLSTPGVVINNNPYKIVPNSLVYDGGEGETGVRSASTGGGSSTSVHSENAETKISYCKFDIYLLAGVDADIARWKENTGSNEIKVLQRTASGESTTLSFDNMSLAPAVERQASADGVTSLEFKGDPMSNQ
jgi:hypothetical protein